MTNLADIHCHLVPYVDDGAYDLEEAESLLREQARQGVRAICLTPHLRRGMFETSQEEIDSQVARLRSLVLEWELPLRLCDSREYHFDRTFLHCMEEGKLRPMGNGNVILVEFGRHDAEEMFQAIEIVKDAGYRPLVAHVERYPAVRQDGKLPGELVRRGAMLQVNAGSLLGDEGLRQKWLAQRLIKEKLVTVVASDAHDMKIRRPNLADCFAILERKYGRETADALLCANPLSLIEDQ